MKVALIHEHMYQEGGAEKVLRQFQALYPDAPTFTTVFNRRGMGSDFASKDIRPSFIQHFPGGVRMYKWFLPLMPAAVERFQLAPYDVVLSSNSCFAKGVITRPDAVHISFCHSHTRYLWNDSYDYVENLHYPRFFKRGIIAPYLSYLRMWDRLAADRVDHFIANSHSIQLGIKKYYQRDSTVIFPPVETHRFSLADAVDKYFVTGGRLVSYKRFDLAIMAANQLGLPLTIFGAGPEEKKLRALAKPNVTFIGRINDEHKQRILARALAFINPQEEDFGITPVEAMAAGRPVIAYARGGALDTVKPGVSGVLFDEQAWEPLADAMIRFRASDYNPHAVKAWAEQFSEERFRSEIRAFVEKHSTSLPTSVR